MQWIKIMIKTYKKTFFFFESKVSFLKNLIFLYCLKKFLNCFVLYFIFITVESSSRLELCIFQFQF